MPRTVVSAADTTPLIKAFRSSVATADRVSDVLPFDDRLNDSNIRATVTSAAEIKKQILKRKMCTGSTMASPVELADTTRLNGTLACHPGAVKISTCHAAKSGGLALVIEDWRV
jgi:hypothetical protein